MLMNSGRTVYTSLNQHARCFQQCPNGLSGATQKPSDAAFVFIQAVTSKSQLQLLLQGDSRTRPTAIIVDLVKCLRSLE